MPTQPAPVRQHAYTGPALPQVSEPSHAERVRTLMSLASVGTLSTLSRKVEGFPFGSLLPFALDGAGRPIFLISALAMHTQNLKADARCSLFVAQPGAEGEALGAARATLVGRAQPVSVDALEEARERYLSRHENSRYWVDFSDFSFFKLQPIDVYYVGGFGVMGWVAASEYAGAAPDPLAESASSILAHMNADHVDAMILLARVHAGFEATGVTMTSVDRLGFSLSVKTTDSAKGIRINFPHEVANPQQTRAALVEMLQQARQR